MAQRRLLNKSLGTSSRRFAKLTDCAGKLADFCQALYPLIMVNCDDHGRLAGDAFSIKNNIFPVSKHSEEDFEEALQAMNAVCLISLYEISGSRYLYLHNFRKEQPGIKYVARSLYPEPPPEVLQKEQFTGIRQDSPEPVSPGVDEERKKESNTKKEREFEEKRSRREVEKKKERGPSRKRETPPPENLPVTDALKEWASKHIPANLLQALDLNRETEKFLEKSRAKGWTYANWEAARKNWLLKAVDFAEERVASGLNGDSGGKNNATNSASARRDPGLFAGLPYEPEKAGE